jgi:hypothetical protein
MRPTLDAHGINDQNLDCARNSSRQSEHLAFRPVLVTAGAGVGRHYNVVTASLSGLAGDGRSVPVVENGRFQRRPADCHRVAIQVVVGAPGYSSKLKRAQRRVSSRCLGAMNKFVD